MLFVGRWLLPDFYPRNQLCLGGSRKRRHITYRGEALNVPFPIQLGTSKNRELPPSEGSTDSGRKPFTIYRPSCIGRLKHILSLREIAF